jgi:aspartate carbamoyltransferase catalytic subunit
MKAMVKAQGKDDTLKGKVLGTVFYEASTRTSTSFNAAMQVPDLTVPYRIFNRNECLHECLHTHPHLP